MVEDNTLNADPIKGLLKKFFITFLLGVVVYRLGIFVPIPGINTAALGKMVSGDGALSAILSYANMFNGGAISQASVFGLGIMPYISASIIFQLLTVSFPALKALQKEGEPGRRKINQYTRYATVLICLVQSGIAMSALLSYTGADGEKLVSAENTFLFIVQSMLVITCGSMVLLWLGEQITKHGVGNGISVIIMVGILSRMPAAFMDIAENNSENALLLYLLVLVVFLAVIAGMVYVTLARRRVNLEQQRRVQGNKVYGGNQTSVPLMLNQASVIPVIFSSPVMMIISAGFGYLALDGLFGYGTAGYRYLFMGMIVFFTYFYISITFDLNDMANNFKQSGFFIKGVRPGKKTVEYLQYRMQRITFVGALSLALIAVLPTLLGEAIGLTGTASSAILGGVGLLIVVGVTLDIIQKVGSFLMASQYQNLMGGQDGKPGKKGGTKAKRF